MKSKQQNTVFIGFHVTPEMDQCIRMNAVARGVSVSQILRELLNKWKDDCDIIESRLISGIVGRIKTDFMISSLKDEVDKAKFLERWRLTLSKKLTEPLINKVIQEYEKSTKASK